MDISKKVLRKIGFAIIVTLFIISLILVSFMISCGSKSKPNENNKNGIAVSLANTNTPYLIASHITVTGNYILNNY